MAPEVLTNTEQRAKRSCLHAVCSGPSRHRLSTQRPPWPRAPTRTPALDQAPTAQEVDSGGPPCAPVTCIWSWDSTQTRVGKVGKEEPAPVSRKHVTLARDLPGGPETAGLRWESASPYLGGPRRPGSGGSRLPPSLSWCHWAGAAHTSQRTEPTQEAHTVHDTHREKCPSLEKNTAQSQDKKRGGRRNAACCFQLEQRSGRATHSAGFGAKHKCRRRTHR